MLPGGSQRPPGSSEFGVEYCGMATADPYRKPLETRRTARRGSVVWGFFWLLAVGVLGTVGWIYYQLAYSPGDLGSTPKAAPKVESAPGRSGSSARPLPPGWGELQRKVLRSLVEGGGSENATMIVFQATW